MADARITELEIRIAHQDRLIEQLDTVMHEFARRVQALERALELLRDQVQNPPEVGPADEKPPHY